MLLDRRRLLSYKQAHQRPPKELAPRPWHAWLQYSSPKDDGEGTGMEWEWGGNEIGTRRNGRERRTPTLPQQRAPRAP